MNTNNETDKQKVKKLDKLKNTAKTNLEKVYDKYEKEPQKMFTYTLIAIGITLLLFIVYAILPEDTIKGVSRNNVVIKEIKEHKEIAFNIVPIPEKTPKAKSDKYIKDVLGFINKNKNQEIYSSSLKYLLNQCETEIKGENEVLYNKMRDYVNKEQLNFDESNNRSLSLLNNCKKLAEGTVVENGKKLSPQMEKYEQEKVALLNELEVVRKERALNKQLYGNRYDEKTDTLKYEMGDEEEISRMKSIRESEENILEQLESLNGRIERLKNIEAHHE